jgi:hypothetical protein
VITMKFTFYQQNFMLNFQTTKNISIIAMKAINRIPGLNFDGWKNVSEKLSIIYFPLSSHYLDICEKYNSEAAFQCFVLETSTRFTPDNFNFFWGGGTCSQIHEHPKGPIIQHIWSLSTEHRSARKESL